MTVNTLRAGPLLVAGELVKPKNRQTLNLTKTSSIRGF